MASKLDQLIHTTDTQSEPHKTLIRRAVWVIALIGLALRLAFALLPLATHLVVLEDDAWMVMVIAKHFAAGNGITADGVNPTTGFQFLYPLTLGALPYAIAPDALDAGFTANLIICALLSTATMLPLWSLARRFGGELAGLIAVTIFSLNPYLIRISVNGMETAMGLLLLLTVFACFYRADLTNVKHLLGLSVLTTLAILTRVDASLAFATISLAMGLCAIQYKPNPRPAGHFHLGPISVDTRRFGLICVYVVATFALLTPYFIFNKVVGGSFSPASGDALGYMHSYGPGKTPAEQGDYHLTNGLNALSQITALDLDWVGRPANLALLLIVFAALAVWLLRWRLFALLPMLLYIPVPPLYYGYLLQQARTRYFVGISAVFILLIALVLVEIWRRKPKPVVGYALAAVVALIVALNTNEAVRFYHEKTSELDQTQPTLYQAALWIRDNMPEDALIGAKNSGILQYYSGRVVLNIDGKLNPEIVPVMERRELLDYLYDRGVTHLIDREETMARHITFYSHELSDAPLHTTPSIFDRLIIYGKILGNKFGAQLPLDLASRDDYTPTRPFSDVAEIIQTFARPNQTSNPVVIYRLLPEGSPSSP